MLSIGELAEITGVSTRAIRHYHRSGVLPEPDRRRNNYRSYGPTDLIRLVKIRRLLEFGLRLDDIRKLLVDSDPASLRTALVTLDGELARQQAEIERRRARIATLVAGGGSAVALPPELAAIVEEMAAAGVAGVDLERDALALLVALHPERVDELVALQRSLVAAAGGDLAGLSHRFAALAPLDPDDPRVRETAQLIAGLAATATVTLGTEADRADTAFVERYFSEALSPAQHRCAELVTEFITGASAGPGTGGATGGGPGAGADPGVVA